MNADTQQWLLCNTSPDVLAMMPPTIMVTLNPRLVYSGLLAQCLHGTVVVAGNILLGLVKHIFSCFRGCSFPIPPDPLLSPLAYNRFSCKAFHLHISSCGRASHLWSLYSEKGRWTGLKGACCCFTGESMDFFSLCLLCRITKTYSYVYKTEIISSMSWNWVKALQCFNSVWRLRENNSYILKLFLTLDMSHGQAPSLPWNYLENSGKHFKVRETVSGLRK